MSKKLKVFLKKYENRISLGALIVGFIIDSITLRGLDRLFDNIVLISYLLIAGICIIGINLYDSKKNRSLFLEKSRPWFMIVLQFVLGGCFSAFFIFYTRSATLVASWPFLIFILAYLVGNEFLKKHYSRLSAQLGVYYMAIFSFCILIVPMVLRKIGDWVFVLSGLLSLIIFAFFVYVLKFVTKTEMRKFRKAVFGIVGSIFIIMNVLYFTNIIPPAPLSLREIGLYTSVKKNIDGTYALEGGNQKGFLDLFNKTENINLDQGESLYLFSSIFSPAKLNTNVVHVWYTYDEKTKKWSDVGRIELSIFGGRDDGYRTYSVKEALFAGMWRVDIESESGQIIGRKTFKIQ